MAWGGNVNPSILVHALMAFLMELPGRFISGSGIDVATHSLRNSNTLCEIINAIS